MLEETDQRIFFDNIAEEWDRIVSHRPDKLGFIAGMMELSPGQRVLDVGCGTGVMLPYLLRDLRPGGVVHALDFSPRMIEVARRKYPVDQHPELRYYNDDISRFTFNGEYDAILCYSSFPHFAHHGRIMHKLAAGLKEGGRLIVAHADSRETINQLHGDEEGYLPEMDEIARSMEQAGLHVSVRIDSDEMFLIMGDKY